MFRTSSASSESRRGVGVEGDRFLRDQDEGMEGSESLGAATGSSGGGLADRCFLALRVLPVWMKGIGVRDPRQGASEKIQKNRRKHSGARVCRGS